MARHASTYRGARRNASRKIGLSQMVHLNPTQHRETNFYTRKSHSTTAEMLRTGKRWFYALPQGWLRKKVA